MRALRASPWIVATIIAACSSHDEPPYQPCTPGETSSCTCADGSPGAQICADTGDKYGACECTNPGTGGGSGAAGCSGAADPDWASVVAYIPCVTDIADATGRATVATFNEPMVSSSPPGAPGGASCSLGNQGAYGTARGFTVSMPAAIHTGDFTVEFWLYETAWHDPTDRAGEIVISSSAADEASGNPYFPQFWSGAGTDQVTFGGGMNTFADTGSALNVWESYAASRTAGTTYLFRNGGLLTSFADTNDYTDAGFNVSHQGSGAYNAMMGSIAQIRVTLVGRYTSDYTPCRSGFATSQ